ncbi:hypothetical protein RCO28_15755 [Streptomyces sp. LHD-70]|uniref:hypothetical protein n=1 Tax=Streptomyces sp. LHD-70 TaxID=3072140 RepID=UPI002810035A|nr:hypothetical protein [Streptomyces sp. LHD-70]MDQ8703938.1 hypothetical protein [Streptomyces sp. LHD-70]
MTRYEEYGGYEGYEEYEQPVSSAAGPCQDASPDPLRARLAVAQAACELAELARAAVPVGRGTLHADGSPRTPGATLAEAARVLDAARRYVTAAERYERLGGTGACVDAWWRTYTDLAPHEAAADLDDWVLRHGDGAESHGPAPVSAALWPTDTGRT